MRGKQNAIRWHMDEDFLILLHINFNMLEKKIENQIHDFMHILA